MSQTLAQPATALLDRWGPGTAPTASLDEARAWCRRFTAAHRENFSVLSALVPPGVREDFAAIYAFCRWADDLGDEAGDPAEALRLLAWWREELQACYHGAARHPIFVALRPVIERHDLAEALFDRLIQAFEWDNRQTRWASMEELTRYCRLSADPVGRLVLAVLGEARDEAVGEASDRVCTALQLVNHWQDVRRDLLERGRIYLPRDAWSGIDDFEPRLAATARRGWAPDRDFLPAYRGMLAQLCDHAEALFDRGHAVLSGVGPVSRPVIGLFIDGGRATLSLIRRHGYETCVRRPALGRAAKLALVARAWIAARRGGVAR